MALLATYCHFMLNRPTTDLRVTIPRITLAFVIRILVSHPIMLTIYYSALTPVEQLK
jgi:hypothetical protein